MSMTADAVAATSPVLSTPTAIATRPLAPATRRGSSACSPSTSDAVSRLAQAYARQRHTVIDLIYSEPDDEILTFADAFKLWKGK